MTDSPITKALNHLSNTAMLSAFMAGVGYLCARAVVHLNSSLKVDPIIGLASGAAAGAIIGLFTAEGSNTASKIVALAALFFVPFHMCKRLEIPATYQTVVALTAASVIVSGVALLILSVFE